MKYALPIIALCALGACGSTGGGSSVSTLTAPSTGGTPTAPSAPSNNSFSGMLNNVRAANGAGPVAYDSRLGRAAQAHANDMLRHGYFDHTGRDGSSAGDRIKRAGYDWKTWGENIARGQSTEQQVMQGWTNSPGHHANNIEPSFEDFGLAKAGSGSNRYWVLVLAAEQ